ncbi:hypothetical protein BDQ12DRAFT_681071 [Crucibulum laeve]|uniref:SWI5-dependent HO expression protein 3 n=1 Tax=Crucibulum laeve TaxID=68775 RepID=A0A5C3M2S4_9AGAR|nr:hypothetical protein BDQ12DRAFT_681071 [Crucibulum laeve]
MYPSSSDNSYPATSPSPRLSPIKYSRERSTSRPSSRTSLRAHSPSFSLDDPVAVRNQVSTLKHTIRHQQAQLHSLENIIRIGPRPYSTDLLDDNNMASTSTSPPSAFASPTATSTKVKRRSSYDVLQNLAGPESSLPLPRRDGIEENGIREGIPMNFGANPASPTSYKRVSSPTRTLSRIPVASVGNARALADEGQPPTQRPSPSGSTSKLSPIDPDSSIASSSSLIPPPSPNRRISLTPGGTTKVLADLQTGVVNARNALENTKAQLRLSQRSVAQLTRQTEDLKEGRERLRLENEGLNNVVARKERLLQEVLERARKAETEATVLKSQLKSETSTSKKALREMEASLSESTALSQKSEREYITLRDSMKGLIESWKQDTDRLREEMRKREEKLKAEAESVGKKYRLLVEEVKGVQGDRDQVKKLKEEDKKKGEEVEEMWKEEIERMKGEVARSARESEEANKTAKHLAEELARLRRLMQRAGRRSSSSPIPEEDAPP